MTELALDTELTNEQKEYLDMVRTSAHSLLGLINDILDFSKIEAGQLEVESVGFDLRDTISNVVNTISILASQKGLQTGVHIDADIPDTLVGDPTRLSQILENLAGNAIKFTEHGEVTISVDKQSETREEICLHFAVSDTGVGIPPDKQELIFSAFAQADSSTTRQYGGTGLGLAISSQLVTLMGGKIWVDSVTGEGSTFHFNARFGLRRGMRSDAISSELLESEFLPMALVVDDEEDIRQLLCRSLAQKGWQSIAVDSGQVALKHLTQHRFNLIFLDLMMPGINGAVALKEIRRVDPKVKVVIITAYPEADLMAQALQSGPFAVMRKPFTLDELSLAIGDAANRPDTTEAINGPGIARQSGTELKRQPTKMDVSDETTGGKTEGRPGERSQSQAKAIQQNVGGPSFRRPQQVLQILLAEDNLINQRLVMRIMEKQGHAVTVANNGKEVLCTLEKESFDLILMDVQMPVMDGFETTAAVREKEKAAQEHIPIVAMTAHAMKGDCERCLEMGMDAYVVKPINVEDLLQVIERLKKDYP